MICLCDRANKDNTGLNAVKLHCYPSNGIRKYIRYTVKSTEVTFGEFTNVNHCEENDPMVSFQVKLHERVGKFKDDAGATGI